jgi:murein DD-endopeptidase MepM/ murein hydrolase activator NlpD
MLDILWSFLQQRRRSGFVAVVLLLGLTPALACPFAPGGSDLSGQNAYWNAPTATPRPQPPPRPTTCTQVVPTPACPLCTPAPAFDECTTPEPTLTPYPSATPYGRWFSPGDRGTSGTFYRDQDVRIGPLRLRLQNYTHNVPIPGAGGEVAHVWTFDTQNEGTEPLTITWPLQLFVREITGADGTTTAGAWWETSAAERAAGLPAWSPTTAGYQPGEHKVVTVAIQGPAGTARAVGFLPDPVGGRTSRQDVGQAGAVMWFVPEDDPYASGNTDGPSSPADGGAVGPKVLPSPAPSLYGYFAGWPVQPNGGSVVSQPFGCTAFHELSGYDCPNDQPWFHTGLDIADPSRPLLLSVVRGRVTYIGVSPGHQCSWPGSEAPHTNLGWVIQLQVVDETDHTGPYTVKYGHTQPGSERVRVGDLVQPGQVLAQMASTGCSTGAHVHLQIQNEAGRFLDPFNFIGERRQ